MDTRENVKVSPTEKGVYLVAYDYDDLVTITMTVEEAEALVAQLQKVISEVRK